jgi:hypothetical protein
MTIKDLKAELRDMDDSYTVILQRPDGTKMGVTKVSMLGNQLAIFMER